MWYKRSLLGVVKLAIVLKSRLMICWTFYYW